MDNKSGVKVAITKKIKDQKTFEYMMYALVLIGVIMSTVTGNMQRNNKENNNNLVQATAIGYIISAIALILLIPFSIKFNTAQVNAGQSMGKRLAQSIWRILGYPLPTIITIGVLVFAATQTLMFKDRIAKHHVANEYFTWINTFSTLLVLQLVILFYYLIKDTDPNGAIRYVVYLFSLFNFILLGITQTILQFFSTDG